MEQSFLNWNCSTKLGNILEMTVLHQIENSLEMTVLHQTEESLKWPCSTKLRKVLKMTVFHQIGKHFRNDCAPPNWEKFRNDCVPPNWGKFKMTVFHQIEKSLHFFAVFYKKYSESTAGNGTQRKTVILTVVIFAVQWLEGKPQHLQSFH